MRRKSDKPLPVIVVISYSLCSDYAELMSAGSRLCGQRVAVLPPLLVMPRAIPPRDSRCIATWNGTRLRYEWRLVHAPRFLEPLPMQITETIGVSHAIALGSLAKRSHKNPLRTQNPGYQPRECAAQGVLIQTVGSRWSDSTACTDSVNNLLCIFAQLMCYALAMPKAIAEILRSAIERSKLSASQLSRRTDVPVSVITRFLGGADMRLSNAEKIAAYLGLTLKRDKRK